MVYVKKRKPYKKRTKYVRRTSARAPSIAKTVKSIMYKQMETKSRIEMVTPGISLFHNLPRLIGSNLLITVRGICTT